MVGLRDNSQAITIQGIVSPAGWDDTGQINAVCIVTDPEMHYFAFTENRNLDLLKFLKKEVSVEGRVKKRRGTRYISVTRIVEIRRVFSEQLESD